MSIKLEVLLDEAGHAQLCRLTQRKGLTAADWIREARSHPIRIPSWRSDRGHRSDAGRDRTRLQFGMTWQSPPAECIDILPYRGYGSTA